MNVFDKFRRQCVKITAIVGNFSCLYTYSWPVSQYLLQAITVLLSSGIISILVKQVKPIKFTDFLEKSRSMLSAYRRNVGCRSRYGYCKTVSRLLSPNRPETLTFADILHRKYALKLQKTKTSKIAKTKKIGCIVPTSTYIRVLLTQISNKESIASTDLKYFKKSRKSKYLIIIY